MSVNVCLMYNFVNINIESWPVSEHLDFSFWLSEEFSPLFIQTTFLGLWGICLLVNCLPEIHSQVLILVLFFTAKTENMFRQITQYVRETNAMAKWRELCDTIIRKNLSPLYSFLLYLLVFLFLFSYQIYQLSLSS